MVVLSRAGTEGRSGSRARFRQCGQQENSNTQGERERERERERETGTLIVALEEKLPKMQEFTGRAPDEKM